MAGFDFTKLDSLGVEQARRAINYSDMIAMLDPNQTALYSITQALGKKVTTDNPKFAWFEDKYLSFNTAINNGAGYTAAATSLIVDDANIFRPFDIMKALRTGEVMLVTAINSVANTVTVVRGYGSTAAAALVDNDDLMCIGNANPEGSSYPEMKGVNTQEVFNYTQIFKTPVSLTRTAADQKMYAGGDEYTRRLKKAGVAHGLSMERAFLYGEKSIDTTTSSDGPIRMTGGILSFINTNVRSDVDHNLTQAEWEAFLNDLAFANGSQKKLVLVGGIIAQALNQWMYNKVSYNKNMMKYGLRLMEYECVNGVANITHSRLLDTYAAGKGMAVVVDIENIKQRPFVNADTKLQKDIQAPGQDKKVSQYLTEVGLQVELEETHALLNGVTSYT